MVCGNKQHFSCLCSEGIEIEYDGQMANAEVMTMGPPLLLLVENNKKYASLLRTGCIKSKIHQGPCHCICYGVMNYTINNIKVVILILVLGVKFALVLVLFAVLVVFVIN